MRKQLSILAVLLSVLGLLATPSHSYIRGKVVASNPRTVLNGYSRFTSMAFANFAKLMTACQLRDGMLPTELNDDGYPITTPTGSAGYVCLDWLPGQYKSDGTTLQQYFVKWKPSPGKARQGSIYLQFGMSITAVGGTVGGITYGTGGQSVGAGQLYLLINGAVTPRVVFTLDQAPSPNGDVVSFPPYGGVSLYDQMGDLIIGRIEDEAAIDADPNVTTTEWGTANTGTASNVLRDMNWTIGGADVTFVSNTNYRWLTSAASFFADRMPSGLWAGTVSGTDTYTVAAPPDGFTLVDGATVQVLFAHTNTVTTPTMNIGGTGAKRIANNRGENLEVSPGIECLAALDGCNPSAPTTMITTLMYNAAIDAFISKTGGMGYGPPREVRVAYANRLNMSLWTNFPFNYTATSAQSDTAYISANLNSNLNGWFEWNNEVWNFVQSTLAKLSGEGLGFPSGSLRANQSFTGLKFKQLMDAASIGWGVRDATQFRPTMAVWAFSPSGTADTNTYQLQGSDLASVANGGSGNARYITYTSNANYRNAPNRPFDIAKVFSYATYYEGAQLIGFPEGQYGNAPYTAANMTGLKGAADDYASGVPAQMASALAWVDNDVRQGTINGSLAGQTLLGLKTVPFSGLGIYGAWQAMLTANSYTQKVDNYEGGLQITYPSTASSTAVWGTTIYGGAGGRIDNLIRGYWASSYAQQIVVDQANDFVASGANARYTSWFLLDDNNQWSLYNGNVITGTKRQMWNGVRQFNLQFLLKRDMQTPEGANDNSPMWLEKAA